MKYSVSGICIIFCYKHGAPPIVESQTLLFNNSSNINKNIFDFSCCKKMWIFSIFSLDALPTDNFDFVWMNSFSVIRSLNKHFPVMVMEFWTGWFDFWGKEKHASTSVKGNIRHLSLCFSLSLKKSFNHHFYHEDVFFFSSSGFLDVLCGFTGKCIILKLISVHSSCDCDIDEIYKEYKLWLFFFSGIIPEIYSKLFSPLVNHLFLLFYTHGEAWPNLVNSLINEASVRQWARQIIAYLLFVIVILP